jgi:hypothetical protein
MGRILSYIILIIGLLLPQLLVTDYQLLVFFWVSLGVLVGFFFKSLKVFLPTFFIQLGLGLILFGYVAGNSTAYLQQIPAEFNLPGFLIIGLAVLFNALNASICILAGAAFVALFFPSHFRSRKYVNIYK